VAALKKEIATAQAQTKADEQSFQKNQEPSTTWIQVVVNNHTTQPVAIVVNGFTKAIVFPKTSKVIAFEHDPKSTVPTVLTAFDTENNLCNWGPRNIWGQFTKYKWNIE
jgi:hypothetical protein